MKLKAAVSFLAAFFSLGVNSNVLAGEVFVKSKGIGKNKELVMFIGSQVDWPRIALRPDAVTTIEFPGRVSSCINRAASIDINYGDGTRLGEEKGRLFKSIVMAFNAKDLSEEVMANLPNTWVTCWFLPKDGSLTDEPMQVFLGAELNLKDAPAKVRLVITPKSHAELTDEDLKDFPKVKPNTYKPMKMESLLSGFPEVKAQPVKSEGKK